MTSEEGRPTNEDAIRHWVGAEDCDRFRLDHTLRHKGRLPPTWAEAHREG